MQKSFFTGKKKKEKKVCIVQKDQSVMFDFSFNYALTHGRSNATACTHIVYFQACFIDLHHNSLLYFKAPTTISCKQAKSKSHTHTGTHTHTHTHIYIYKELTPSGLLSSHFLSHLEGGGSLGGQGSQNSNPVALVMNDGSNMLTMS